MVPLTPHEETSGATSKTTIRAKHLPARKKPIAVAIASGATQHHPERYRARPATQGEPLGRPPAWLTVPQRRAWRELVGPAPWLERPHQAIVSMAAILLARLHAGDAQPAAMN